MPRVPRDALPDGFFHVTSRGVARTAIFRDESDYTAFRTHLLTVGRSFEWTIYTYCLMPNHYHVILAATRADLSKGMQRLNARYAQRFNRRYDRYGHLFQNRFSSWVIEDEEHFERAVAYVLANPVKAGLCACVGDWPWAAPLSDPD